MKSSCTYGIGCCRFSDGVPEILLVKRRTTYYYKDFIFGKYRDKKDKKRLLYLFSKMTNEELIDIYNMNFECMWYRITLKMPEKELLKYSRRDSTYLSKLDYYTFKKGKFERNFSHDNGRYLKGLLNIVKKKENLIWEIPKGKKNSATETDLEAANREFTEETNYYSNNFIINTTKCFENFTIDDNIKYKSKYFMAWTNINHTPKVNFKTNQIYEIIDIKWISEDNLKYITCFNKQSILSILNFFKQNYNRIT